MPPTRIWLAVTMFLMVHRPPLYCQYMSSSRAIGIGAFTSLSDNENAIDWNPAGLTGIRDWQTSFTNYSSSHTGYNLAFQSAGVGTFFAPSHAAAVRVSPGIEVDFTIPSLFTLQDSVHSFNTTFDKKISHQEVYAAGYGYLVNEDVSAGLSVHAFEQKITDTRYSIDSLGNISASLADYTGRVYTFDAGVSWNVQPWLKFGAVIKNALRFRGSELPEYLSQYQLSEPVGGRAGIAVADNGRNALALDVDDTQRFRFGGEWHPADYLQARTGLYIDDTSPTAVDAVGMGIGGTFDRFQVDLGYLKFTSQENRRGKADALLLDRLNVNNLEYNVFTGDHISFTASLRIGQIGQTDLRIEYADLTQEIFPAARAMYALSPIGKARVRNVSSKPLDAKISFFIERCMDRPTETPPQTIQPGEVKEIPFFALLNDAMRSNPGLQIRDGEVSAIPAGSSGPDDHYQLRVPVHGKNDWNGDARLLRFFVTPGDSAVLSFTRTSLRNHQALLDTLAGETGNFTRAQILFNDFAADLSYVNDPKLSQDNVQYPAETLRLHGGDCDDMTVTYSTLLSSIGISVAYVDVVPPAHPEESHIYLLFDTGISPSRASLVGNNAKRYVVRRNENGTESIWIPIETTAIRNGFQEAWDAGAKEYFNDIEVSLGLVKGWVRVVDLDIPQ